MSYVLEDRTGVQDIPVSFDQPATWVQVTILSVYPGWKYTDTAVTEFAVITD
jgi:hypothetical protein